MLTCRDAATGTKVFGLTQAKSSNAANSDPGFSNPTAGPPVVQKAAQSAEFSEPPAGPPVTPKAAVKPAAPAAAQAKPVVPAAAQAKPVAPATNAEFSNPSAGPPILPAAAKTPVGKAPAKVVMAQASVASVGPAGPVSAIVAGSQAQVAAPASGLNAQTASVLLPPSASSNFTAAVLPGEKAVNLLAAPTQNQQTQLAQSIQPAQIQQTQPAQTAQPANTVPIPVPVPQTQASTSTQEIERFQFIGQIDVNQANADPRNIGPRAALLPRISLIVETPGQAAQSIDMTTSTRTYLLGIRGVSSPSGTFVMPGRILRGADGSGSGVGLYIVALWVVAFIVTLSAGTLTRLQQRREFRAHAARVGKRFATRHS